MAVVYHQCSLGSQVAALSGSFSASRLVFSLAVVRQRGYYVWKIFVPLSLIVFMSFAVFWIDPRHLAAQITIGTSSVLTLIAFQLSLAHLLPELSYLTRADQFAMGSMALVFLAFGEAVCTGFMADKRRKALARKMDLASRWLFPLGFLILLAVSFWL